MSPGSMEGYGMTIQFAAPLEPVGAHVTDFMEEYAIRAPTLAKRLNVSRSRLQRLLEGARCDGDMAVRLSRAFGTTPEYWLNLQSLYDLSLIDKDTASAIEREVVPLAIAE